MLCHRHMVRKRFGKHFLSWLLLTFLLNPMLLYYAFEARAYGWYMAFIALALYGYLQKNGPSLFVPLSLDFIPMSI